MKRLAALFLLLMLLLPHRSVFASDGVIYENDFSDPATISDFSQYRHEWVIKDGALRCTSKTLDKSVTDSFSHILYNAKEPLADYVVEVDFMNATTTGGIVFRADGNRASHIKNGFFGYIAFGASTGNKGAFGHANAAGAWGGNINVGAVAYSPGDDIHIKVIVKGNYVNIEMTNIATGKVVYAYTYSIGSDPEHTQWKSGTVGFRLNGTSGFFDNFRISSAENVSVPSDVPAEDYGAGVSFVSHTGRYMLEKPLPKMPYTFEATMYFPYTASSDYTHIILSNFQRGKSGFIFEITKGGQPSLMFYDEKDVRTRYTFSGVNVYNGEKTHIAIACDISKKSISCYENGILAQTLSLTVDPADFCAEYINLGTDHREINLNLFSGALIDVACYSDVRTAEEIRADMEKPQGDGLLLHYDMANSAYGDNITDLSPSGCNAIFEKYWLDEVDGVDNYAYSIAVVGDTQHNVQYQPDTFAKLYDWLAANASAKKTAFMLGLGDITNDSTDEQWKYAVENMEKLDGIIPYALTRGNHDKEDAYSLKFRGTAYEKAVGKNFLSTIANSWQTFKAGKVNYLVITLDYNPSDTELAWAKKVANSHPYHRVIVITHSNLDSRGELSAHGENIWSKLVNACPNIEMVLSGHVFNDKIVETVSRGKAGNKVTQFMINGQCVDCTRIYADESAAGLVAMFYFDESGRRLSIRYYSTSLDKYFMECNQYETAVGNIAGDTDYDGKVTLADTFAIYKAVTEEKVCYNGDVNGDLALDAKDVLLTINHRIVEHLIGK
ncbi:MAG: hypothetical protein E7619_06060 [Ruminococcaceae bacterium]|nr:hypothetical protein [Oscillospiraceae bacterium]